MDTTTTRNADLIATAYDAPGRINIRWTPDQFDAFTTFVTAGVGTPDQVVDLLIAFGCDAAQTRAIAEAARPYLPADGSRV